MQRGVEKVVLNSAAWKRPALVSEVSSVLGSSSTVVSLDVRTVRGSLRRFDHLSGAALRKSDVIQELDNVVEAGAGEILIQSVERDGTLSGPDLRMLSRIAGHLSVPVVYAGGISSLEEAGSVWRTGVNGVGAGAWFVFRGPHRAVLITYPDYESIVDTFSWETG
jgi:cyclase